MTIKFAANRPLTDEEEAEIQRMIASDPDAPEAIDEQIAQAKPFTESFPDVLAKLKASGRGWQSRIDDILREAVGL